VTANCYFNYGVTGGLYAECPNSTIYKCRAQSGGYSGGLQVNFPSGVTELWIRMHVKFSPTWRWTGIGFFKLLYFTPSAIPEFVSPDHLGIGSGTLDLQSTSGGWNTFNAEASFDPASENGAGTYKYGSGVWHVMEWHINAGISPAFVQTWIDGVLFMSGTSASIGGKWASGVQNVLIMSNENRLSSDYEGNAIPTAAGDYYAMVDDIAIATPSYTGFVKDAQGNNMIGPIGWGLPDTTPPVRSNGQPSGTLSAGTANVNMNLTTDEAATCRYSTNPGTDYSLMIDTFSTTGGTIHSTQITGLQNGTNYSYYVRCNDTAGNNNTDDFNISFSINASCAHRSDTDCNGCVDDAELTAFINLWYVDSSNPTLRELMEAIGLWKRGGC
jgi:hypothetical protein